MTGPVTRAITAMRSASDSYGNQIGFLGGLSAAPLVPERPHAPKLDPDAELLRLGDELLEAWGREGDDGLDEAAFSAAFARTGAIVDRICALSPVTLDGLIVKAIAVSWCHSGDTVTGDTVTGESFDEHPSTDMHLCASIVRDLLAIRDRKAA